MLSKGMGHKKEGLLMIYWIGQPRELMKRLGLRSQSLSSHYSKVTMTSKTCLKI